MSTASTERPLVGCLAVVVALGLGACASAGRGSGDGPDMVSPEVQSSFDEAVTAAAEGRTERAESMLKGLTDDHPELIAPQLNLAILYAENGREEESERLLLSLVELSPAVPEAWNQLGILYRRSGRFEDADAAYLAALESDPEYAPAYRNRGVLLDLYLDQPEEALEHYRRFVALNGGDEDVERWIAELELRIERSRAAKVAER